jgi:small subunit ribosomal protein S14
MAAKGKIARNEHRKQVVERYALRRAELKTVIARPTTPDAERVAAQRELGRQPRDASATRVRNRDADGRPRGFLRAFGVSRVRMRRLAHEGYLPGVRKSSW